MSETIDILMELLNEYQESECAIAEDRVTYYADRLDGRTEDERMDERTETEQNGVGITDELRERIAAMCKVSGLDGERLYAIADRIDEQHRRGMATAQQVGYNEGEDAAMRDGWAKLPVDADGVPIHMGDNIEIIGGEEGTVVAIELCEGGWSVNMRPTGWDTPTLFDAESVRHVQPDTWEQIIEDAMHAFLDDDSPAEPTKEELVERCKRLAGDTE